MTCRPALKSAMIAAAIGAQFLVAGMPAAHAQASAGASASAQAAPKDTLRPEVSKPLMAAQELAQAGKNQEAMAKIDEAEAVKDKSPYEAFLVDRVRGPVAYNSGDDATAVKSLEKAMTFERVSAEDKPRLANLLANSYFRMKSYPKAIEWGNRYFADGGKDEMAMRNLLARSHFLVNDFQKAADELKKLIALGEQGGKVAQEDHLRLMAVTYLKLNDRESYGAMLEKLVTHYPKKEYWMDLLARLFSKKTYSDRLTLDGYRLKLATGTMEETHEYVDLAELAMRAGFPAEAKKVLDAGFAAGMLGTGSGAAQHKKLHNQAAKAVADDQKSMAAGEADAMKKKEGTALVNLGYAYVTAGNPDKGLPLVEEGLKRGGFKNPEEVKLHAALAYVHAGKKAEALERLATVKGADGTGDLARYWAMYVNQQK